MNGGGGRNDDMVDERFVLDTLSMLVNVSLKCCDDQVSDVAHKLVFEILSSKAGPLHGQMLRMCSLLCTPSSKEFAKIVVDFMDRAYFSASDGSKSWLVQVRRCRACFHAFRSPDLARRTFQLFFVQSPMHLRSLSFLPSLGSQYPSLPLASSVPLASARSLQTRNMMAQC